MIEKKTTKLPNELCHCEPNCNRQQAERAMDDVLLSVTATQGTGNHEETSGKHKERLKDTEQQDHGNSGNDSTKSWT